MCSLSIFPPPPLDGYVTVCEKNGELLAMLPKDAEMNSHDMNLKFPQVNILSDNFKASFTKETARSAFLEHNETLMKKLRQSWYEDGITGIIKELSTTPDDNSVKWLSKISGVTLRIIETVSSLYGRIFPKNKICNEDMVEESSSNLDWKNSAIRCIAWHPHAVKFAIALKDDVIKVYTNNFSDIIPILKHKLQKNISSIAWKPMSASILAVGCEIGVIVWHVDPTSLTIRPSSSGAQVLIKSGHSPVTSIAWDPNGDFLLSSSTNDSSIIVWDICTERCVPLRRYGDKGITSLLWSNNGLKLMSCCKSSMFRVWECQSWSCESWSMLSSPCKASCWSPDGSVLLFCTSDEPIIYSLWFSNNSKVIDGAKNAIPCADLSDVELPALESNIKVGGLIQNMVWDQNGERLAVHFKDGASELIALFQTRLQPMFDILPCGFIRGLPTEIPHIITFKPAFEHGSLLTIVWSSGRISYLPLFYFSKSNYAENHSLNGTLTQMFSDQ